MSGTSGQSKRLEAIQIKLTGEIANKYDIYYRVHVQEFGWLDWAKNGASAGSAGYSYRLEAIEIKLIVKNGIPPGLTTRPFVQCYVSYSAHVQDYGWQNKVYDGMISGTNGQSKQLEAIQIKITGEMSNHYDIYYRVHVEN